MLAVGEQPFGLWPESDDRENPHESIFLLLPRMPGAIGLHDHLLVVGLRFRLGRYRQLLSAPF